jgi:DMSO reductase iron-sulfur subunit
MASYGFLLDAKRCIECRACEAACKQWHSVETGVNVRYRRVRVSESGSFPHVRMQAVSMACNHCEDPICIKACPVKVISRRPDGLVLIDIDRCLGCRQCEKFCPYDAPQFNVRTKRMEKCTFCADRIDQDLEPACTAVCPTGALQFGKWEEISQLGEARIDGFSNPALTRPRIRFITAEWGVR